MPAGIPAACDMHQIASKKFASLAALRQGLCGSHPQHSWQRYQLEVYQPQQVQASNRPVVVSRENRQHPARQLVCASPPQKAYAAGSEFIKKGQERRGEVPKPLASPQILEHLPQRTEPASEGRPCHDVCIKESLRRRYRDT